MPCRTTLKFLSDLVQVFWLQVCQVLLTGCAEGGLGRGAQGGVCSAASMCSQDPPSQHQAGCEGVLEARKVCS